MKKEDWDGMEKYVELTWQEAMERVAAGEPVMVLTALNPGAVTLEEFSAMTPVGPVLDEVEPVELEAPEPVEAGEPVEPDEAAEPVIVKAEPAPKKKRVDEGKVRALRAAGWKASAIAGEMGIGLSTVYQVLKGKEDSMVLVTIPASEYRELTELCGRVKAVERYAKKQSFANIDTALAILGLEPLKEAKTDEGA